MKSVVKIIAVRSRKDGNPDMVTIRTNDGKLYISRGRVPDEDEICFTTDELRKIIDSVENQGMTLELKPLE